MFNYLFLIMNRENIIRICKQINGNECSRCINGSFICIDISLIIFCSVQAILFIQYACVVWFYLYMTLIFSSQAMLHYLLIIIATMDAQKYKNTVMRTIFIIAAITFSYLFFSIMYWAAKDIHPIYCALHEVFGLPFWVGIIICLHCAICICSLAHLIHAFITRRFYLLAIGGIEAQRRRQTQLQQLNNVINVRQPNNYYNDYNSRNDSSIDRASIGKYYNFTDIIQQPQKQEQSQTTAEQNSNCCSICLQSKKIQKVKTPCNHIFHKQCLEDWIATRGNESKCPQCREKLRKDQHQSVQEQS